MTQTLETPPQAGARHYAVTGCIGLIVLSCGLDLLFYTGYYASDDAGYVEGAARLLGLEQSGPHPGPAHVRLSIVGWNALVAWLFGFHVPLIAASYVFFHQALNLLTFLLGRRLFDASVGLLAAYFTATAPLIVVFSTCVLPDVMLSALLLLALLLFLWAYDLRAAGRGTRAHLAMLGAGLCVGFGYMAKDTALIMLPFYFVLWLCKEDRRALRRALLTGAMFALGLLVILVAEWAVLSWLTGHSYLRMAWTVSPDGFVERLRRYPYGYYPLDRLRRLHELLRPWFAETRLDFVLLIGALAYPFVRGRKWPVWCFAVWFFAYHTWGSTRLTEYLPPPAQARYFTPVLPALFIVCSFLALRLWRGVPRLVHHPQRSRGLQAVLGVVLVVYPLLGLKVADRRAGKVYDADVVTNATRAINAVKQMGTQHVMTGYSLVPPIVLSGTISRPLRLLYEFDPDDFVVPAHRCRPTTHLHERLPRYGFYYLELYPPRRRAKMYTPDGLDDELHALILAAEAQDPVPQDRHDFSPWLMPQARVVGRATLSGTPGVLRRLKRFDSSHRRSYELAHTIAPALPRRPDFGECAVYVYEWIPDQPMQRVPRRD